MTQSGREGESGGEGGRESERRDVREVMKSRQETPLSSDEGTT